MLRSEVKLLHSERRLSFMSRILLDTLNCIFIYISQHFLVEIK